MVFSHRFETDIVSIFIGEIFFCSNSKRIFFFLFNHFVSLQNHRQNRRPFITNNADRDLDEAYKKGLASTLYKHEIRPDFYGDRDRQVTREQYPYDGNSYTGIDNFKSSHPLKYGLYDPLTNAYARSLNSTISAIGDQKD